MTPHRPTADTLFDLMAGALAQRSTTRQRIEHLMKMAMSRDLPGTPLVRVLYLKAEPIPSADAPLTPLYKQDVLPDGADKALSARLNHSMVTSRQPFAAEAFRRRQANPGATLEFYHSELLGKEFFDGSEFRREVLAPNGWDDVWITVQPMPEDRVAVLVAPRPEGHPGFGDLQRETLRSLALVIGRALTTRTARIEGRVGQLMRDHDLSHAQATVLFHVLDGNTETQIAERIDRSRHTVHGHLREIHRRLGVRSRAELLALHVKDPMETPAAPRGVVVPAPRPASVAPTMRARHA